MFPSQRTAKARPMYERGRHPAVASKRHDKGVQVERGKTCDTAVGGSPWRRVDVGVQTSHMLRDPPTTTKGRGTQTEDNPVCAPGGESSAWSADVGVQVSSARGGPWLKVMDGGGEGGDGVVEAYYVRPLQTLH